MKVRIKTDVCQGHAMCWITCPEVFHVNDADGHAYVSDEIVPPGLEHKVDQAMRSCPEQAIEIE